MDNNYDLIIIGGGPAGMMAGVYALRSGLKTLLIEKEAHGGQVTNSYEIKNYLGFADVTGLELSEKMREQVTLLGIVNLYDDVIGAELNGEIKIIKTKYSGDFTATAVIYALGAYPRELGLEKEKELRGKGVSYCAICDGGFFKDKTVAVVGGGNTAFEEIAYLSKIAKKVYLISRRDGYRAQETLIDTAKKIAKETGKIEFIVNAKVTKLKGNNMLEGVEISDCNTGEVTPLDIDGLFVAIGRIPASEMIKGEIEQEK